jgi:type IV pilus assembly protein PilB
MSWLINTILENEDIQQIQPDFSRLVFIPKDIASKAQTIVYAEEKRRELSVLTTNNFPEDLKKILHEFENKWYTTKVFYTTPEGFHTALGWYDKLEQEKKEEEVKIQNEEKAEWKSAITIMKEQYEIRDTQDPAEFINTIIRLSFQAWASDLHFQPEEDGIVLRLRIDWVLHQIITFTHQEFWKYMQKIKFISGVKMNIDYIPQDGRFSFEAVDRNWQSKKIDARISFMPWIQTESIVIRFLDASQNVEDFKDIWFTDFQMEILERNLQRTSGIIFMTWPTGSWKTTTLYTILRRLNDGSKKIITLEDPIEYKIAGIQQSQINYDKGYDYESGLKAILRQDPDIILVWETRTKETAQIAINASLTWHLVFTTLHTNSVLDTISRLMNMGIEPYLLTPALQLIIGQRLVRKVCPHCWKRVDATPEEDLEIKTVLWEIQTYHPWMGTSYEWKVFKAKGCEYCNDSWFLWRMAIIEVLEITEKMRDKIMKEEPWENLVPFAIKQGFMPMQRDGVLKVIDGLTDLREVHRVAY